MIPRPLLFVLVFALILATAPAADLGGNDPPATRGTGREETPLGNGLGDVVINEIMLTPSAGGPWIELFNAGNDTVSMDDWLISDEDGLEYQVPNLPDVPPGGYVVVHFDGGESDGYFGQSQPNALHHYTGWENVRWTRNVVDSDVHYARVAVGYDMMPGGNPEILANTFGGDRTYMYEPFPDMTLEWDLTNIMGAAPTHRLLPRDIDGDGHEDLVFSWYFGSEGGVPTFSVYWMQAPPTTPKDPWAGRFNIATTRRPEGLDAGLIDGDNIMDVVAGSKTTNEILWFEAPADPTQPNWVPHNLDPAINQPGGLVLFDLDKDSDLDVVAVGSYGEEVVWYEHPPDPLNAWTKHTIAPLVGQPPPDTCSEFDATGELVIGDLDNDNLYDVVVSEAQGHRIVWYEYMADPTGAWTPYVIDDNISGPSGLDFGDLDNDGDVDIAAAATGGQIVWYPQPAQPRLANWPRYTVDGSVHLAFYVDASDLDGDGDLDLVSADEADNRVLWYENEFLEFTAVDQIALYNASVRQSENMVDFVAWGAPPLGQDALAVAAGIWTSDAFVDTTGAMPDETIARDRSSADSDVPQDWNVSCGSDSDTPTSGTVNYPYPTNAFSIEYNPVVFTGGSDAPDGSPPASLPPGLLLANYSGYTFAVEVSNPFGWQDLTEIVLVLDSGGLDINLTWTQASGELVLSGAGGYLIMIPSASSARTDGVYRWLVNFTLYFHWWYPSAGDNDVTVTSRNAHGYESTDIHAGVYTFFRSLRFEDPIMVSAYGQPLATDAWVAPGTELEVMGPAVVYEYGGGRFYPGDSQFNVLLSDDRGNSWVDYMSAGYPVDFAVAVPDVASGAYTLTLSVVDLPPGAAIEPELTHRLRVDADAPGFDDASPEPTTWHTTSIDCSVLINDSQPGSGVSGESIEYRIANGSLDRFGNWIPSPLLGSGESVEPSVACSFPDGADNWIQWRVRDVAGNERASGAFRVPMDMHGVTFHDFYPPPVTEQAEGDVTVNITLADLGGSGVDLGTLEAAIKLADQGDYGGWYEPQYAVVEQTAVTTDALASGPETVRVSLTIPDLLSGTNHVKLRVRDVAGNEYAESEYTIQVGSEAPPETPGGGGLGDYWWIILLVVIIVALAVIAVLNQKRRK